MAERGYLSAVSKHYADVANRYDELYSFANDYIAEFAVEHLQLKPDDLLVDSGAGTGAISHLIWKKAGINLLSVIDHAVLVDNVFLVTY